jgi:hypothetical protein
VTRRLRAFGAFWYDFLIGDDWLLALVVAAGLAATYGLAQAGLAAWWLLPIAVAVTVPVSLWRAVRRARPGGSR